jgi:seryl-tRNA(Sec) selenium transferase
MAKGARKQTSAHVSAIAARILNEGLLTADIHATIADAVQGCGVPLNDRAVLALTNKIEAALEPIVEDVRSLAASCLSQDETPSKAEGFSVPSAD